MARIIGLIVAVLAATLVIYFLFSIDGYTRVEFNGRYIDPPTGLLLGAVLLGALLLMFGTAIFGFLARLPGRLRRRQADKQRDRGMTALTRGLEAVAAGDAGDAQHHARLANKNLESLALTRLLTAQAAQLAGDDDTARGSYAAMLEAPETEFLGLRGLYLQAMHRGDKDEAKAYADRAFRLRPGAPWAFESVYALSVERGQWGDAHEALRLAQRQGSQTTGEAKRKSAALLTARAYAARDAGDAAAAREDAEDALRQDAGLAPAAVLAARLEAEAGKRARAAKTLEAAWAKRPHPAIALAMRDVFSDASAAKRIARLRKLAGRNPDHPESQLLAAELFVEEGNPHEAKALLEPLLLDRPTARTFAVMADAMEALSGPEAAAPWLERAAEAPRDPEPGTNGTFDLTTEGWQRLVREYGEHGRLAPPPLEVMETGLAREELLALTAPPGAGAVDTAPGTVRADGTLEDEIETDDRRGAPAGEAVPVAEAVTVSEEPVGQPDVTTTATDEAAPAPVPGAKSVRGVDGEVETIAARDVAEAPRRTRRFSPFRSSRAEAEAEIDDAIGPEMRDEALQPVEEASRP